MAGAEARDTVGARAFSSWDIRYRRGGKWPLERHGAAVKSCLQRAQSHATFPAAMPSMLST